MQASHPQGQGQNHAAVPVSSYVPTNAAQAGSSPTQLSTSLPGTQYNQQAGHVPQMNTTSPAQARGHRRTEAEVAALPAFMRPGCPGQTPPRIGLGNVPFAFNGTSAQAQAQATNANGFPARQENTAQILQNNTYRPAVTQQGVRPNQTQQTPGVGMSYRPQRTYDSPNQAAAQTNQGHATGAVQYPMNAQTQPPPLAQQQSPFPGQYNSQQHAAIPTNVVQQHQTTSNAPETTVPRKPPFRSKEDPGPYHTYYTDEDLDWANRKVFIDFKAMKKRKFWISKRKAGK